MLEEKVNEKKKKMEERKLLRREAYVYLREIMRRELRNNCNNNINAIYTSP